MAGSWSNIKGTLETLFQFGLAGVGLRTNSGVLEARNAANSAYASVRCLDAQVDGALISPVMSGWVSGCQVANSGADPNSSIDFAAGAAFISDRIVSLTAKTKSLDALWSAGTNQGGLFSGSKAAYTTYHCFAMRNTTTGAVDFGFDTTPTGSNKPSGWAVTWLMAVMTDADNNLRAFLQQGNYVKWRITALDVLTSTFTDGVQLLNLTAPAGIQTLVNFNVWFNGPDSTYLYFTSPENTNWYGDYLQGKINVQSGGVAPGAPMRILTNQNNEIVWSVVGAPGDLDNLLIIGTEGFEFFR